jgi:hypothetical protein
MGLLNLLGNWLKEEQCAASHLTIGFLSPDHPNHQIIPQE